MNPGRQPPHLGVRIAIALSAGVLGGLLLWLRFHVDGPRVWALDFTPYWRAGDAFRHGVSPYVAINATDKGYPCCSAGFLYMFPATIFFLPFSYLPAQAAAVLANTIYVAVFTFALMRDGYWRLPLLLSFPLAFCAFSGQVVPLTTAAFLLPALGWVASIKFTNGAVGFLYTLSRKYFVLAAIPVVLSAVIWPWWPMQFWRERHDVTSVIYHVPILIPFGVLALLALVRWRQPDGRLVAAMACIPQTMLWYDQLPLTLIARSYREALMVAVWSWVVPLLWAVIGPDVLVSREALFAQTAPVIVLGYYLPAAAFVLFRKTRSPGFGA